MKDWMLQLYHRLPGPMRSVPASLRGFHLRSWRFGPESERLVAEALEREHWTREQWKVWQENQLSFVLHRARTQVPYYREHWAERRRRGDRASWEYLENWALLGKDELRNNPKAFVADDCDVRQMFYTHTSGTSGKSIDVWWSRETMRSYYAMFEARTRRWYQVSRDDRWAILGGQLVTPVQQQRPPFWVWNFALNQLYMSSYHLAPKFIPSYLDALLRYRVKYLWGYSSALYALAQEALRLGRRDLPMAVTITNAEPVFEYQRQVIAEAFQCPVRETYGMTELVAAAAECQDGRLHTWPEVGLVEVAGPNQSIANEKIGDLICTTLINKDMPLIRYKVGDRGRLAVDDNSSCTCGRAMPVMAAIEGRVDDTLCTLDGRWIGRLDPVFKDRLPIREAQIIQEALDLIRVRYVPAPDYTAEAGRSVIERLQARMGNVKVILEPIDEVPRGANGKFRAVICNLSAAERNQVSVN